MPGTHPTLCNHPSPPFADGRRHKCALPHRHEGRHRDTPVNSDTVPRRSWPRTGTDDDSHGTVEVSLPASLERRPTPDTLPVTPRMPPLHIDRDLITTHVRADVRVIALLDDDEVLALDLGSVSVADPDKIPGDLATLLHGALRMLDPHVRPGAGAVNSVAAEAQRAVAATTARVEDELTATLPTGGTTPPYGALRWAECRQAHPHAGHTYQDGGPEDGAWCNGTEREPYTPFDVADHERRYAETVQRVHDKVAEATTAHPALGPLEDGPALATVRTFLGTVGYRTWAKVVAAVSPRPVLTPAGWGAVPAHDHQATPATACVTCGVDSHGLVLHRYALATLLGEPLPMGDL